jgi:hypothetical protein
MDGRFTIRSRGAAVALVLTGLGAGTLLGLSALGSEAEWLDSPRTGAACLGIAAGTTTVFLLLSGLVYFSYAGDYVLPLARLLSELLSL